MRKPRVLLTGFSPFGGEAINPSWQIAAALHGQVVAGARIRSLELPCVFGQALEVLHAAIDLEAPCLVLALGQAAGRAELSLERVAVNLDDADSCDNAGAQPRDQAVVAGAPVAYFSSLPLKAICAALREQGIPAGLSSSAGSFVCNHVFYALQHGLAQRARAAARAAAAAAPGALRKPARPVPSGFMHVPLLPEQCGARGLPSMGLDMMLQGTRTVLATSLKWARV